MSGERSIKGRIVSTRRWLGYRWRRIKRLPWTVLAILVGVAVISSLAGLRDAEQGLADLWLNLGTELAGAVVTYVLLDLVLGTRQRKQALIAQLRSGLRNVAVAAAEELEREGWLYDGSLRGAVLAGANLEGADLRFADLAQAHLGGANLEAACLGAANLQEAFLVGAKLGGASLGFAELQDADLRGAKLEGAHLDGANLEGARVSLRQLACAKSFESATLPDGTKLSG